MDVVKDWRRRLINVNASHCYLNSSYCLCVNFTPYDRWFCSWKFLALLFEELGLEWVFVNDMRSDVMGLLALPCSFCVFPQLIPALWVANQPLTRSKWKRISRLLGKSRNSAHASLLHTRYSFNKPAIWTDLPFEQTGHLNRPSVWTELPPEQNYHLNRSAFFLFWTGQPYE